MYQKHCFYKFNMEQSEKASKPYLRLSSEHVRVIWFITWIKIMDESVGGNQNLHCLHDTIPGTDA